MQVTGAIVTENIYRDKVVKMDRGRILLNLRNELINPPKCGFIRTTEE